MAKQPTRTAPPPKGKAGKAGKGKPITSHQLFPAVVALWFGALFGLGSLAVRPSLLESVVMKSRLDLVVPAAAPPLGITARILIALIMAALGSVIGVLIARRIARPKLEAPQRKRGAKSADEAPRTSYFGQAEPANVFDEAASNSGILAGRRRGSLAIDHSEVDFVPHEMAPLPGGAPQVLDISGIELAEHAPAHDEPEPLDLGEYARNEPAAATFAAPPVQSFQPQVQPVAASSEPYDLTPQAYLPAEPTQAQRQIFGMPVENDHVDQSFVREAGFKTSVFETEEPAPLFPGRQPQVAVSEPASPAFAPPVAAPVAAPAAFAAPTLPIVPEPAAEAAPAFAAPAAEAVPAFAAPVAEPVPAFAAPFAGAAEPAPVAEPTDGLGMTDLASRLQQSMLRRRAARGDAAAAVSAPAASAFAAPETAPETAPEPDLAASIPAALAPPLAEAPAVFAPAFDEPSAPAGFDPPVTQEPAAFAAPAGFNAPFAAPAAPEPVVALAEATSLLTPAPAHAEPDPVAVVPPPPMAMPAALRPLNLDQDLNDDDDMLASLLPPRHVPMPAPVLAAAPAPFAPFASPDETEAAAPEEVAEPENYASLLDIGQPPAPRATGFVRIDEPEVHGGAVEPVVIFPGQGTFAQPQAAALAPSPLAPVAPVTSDSDAVPFRRFDAPSAAGQGAPVAAPMGPQGTDPAEADQALRAALANLQRMSGAA